MTMNFVIDLIKAPNPAVIISVHGPRVKLGLKNSVGAIQEVKLPVSLVELGADDQLLQWVENGERSHGSRMVLLLTIGRELFKSREASDNDLYSS